MERHLLLNVSKSKHLAPCLVIFKPLSCTDIFFLASGSTGHTSALTSSSLIGSPSSHP